MPVHITDDNYPDWESYGARIGLPQDGAARALVPDFMIVSPARTGTTWLARNLARHPEIFVPEAKELHFFDAGWARHDLHWYLEHFRGSSARIKGEATPTYSLLPRFAIRHLRRINPALKLIFLLRDPAERAWSNTKHSFMYPEFEFRDSPMRSSLAQDDAIKYLVGDYSICSSDYAGILDRWTECFPRDQVYVELLDTVALQPELALKRVFGFLGVDTEIDLQEFSLREKIFSGRSDLPGADVQQILDRFYRARVPELRNYFKSNWGIEVPWRESEATVGNEQDIAWLQTRTEAPDRQPTDDRLSRILCRLPRRFFQDLPDVPDPSLPLITGHHKDYNIVAFRGRHFGFHTSLGAVSPADYALLERSDSTHVVIADSAGEVRAQIDLQASAGKADQS